MATPGEGRGCRGWECLQVHFYFTFPWLQGVIVASCFVKHFSEEWLPSLLPPTVQLGIDFPLSPTFSRLTHLPQPCFIQLRLLLAFQWTPLSYQWFKTGQSIGAVSNFHSWYWPIVNDPLCQGVDVLAFQSLDILFLKFGVSKIHTR